MTALETLEPEKLNIDFVKSRLLDEFTKRKQLESASSFKSNNSVAMSASATSNTDAFVARKLDTKLLIAE